MVDRSYLETALIIADRGYENYNLMAHIQEKGWFFLIRIKDIHSKKCMAAALDLPDTDSFDLAIDLALTRTKNKETSGLFNDRNHFRFLPSTSTFDFLPKGKPSNEGGTFYLLPFRIVRFKITEESYETVVTNLPKDSFPPAQLKELYNMRWGIETSFRELKYTVGLLHFHAKKVEYIYQEIFARLIMYNFAELITSHVVVKQKNRKYPYRINFAAAVHICRNFFLKNISPSDIEALLLMHLLPVRQRSANPRRGSPRVAPSFIYRIP